jgi:hypothetical protein
MPAVPLELCGQRVRGGAAVDSRGRPTIAAFVLAPNLGNQALFDLADALSRESHPLADVAQRFGLFGEDPPLEDGDLAGPQTLCNQPRATVGALGDLGPLEEKVGRRASATTSRRFASTRRAATRGDRELRYSATRCASSSALSGAGRRPKKLRRVCRPEGRSVFLAMRLSLCK